MADTTPKADGRFAKGTSGNPGGRPSRKGRHSHAISAVNRRCISEAAQTQITINLNGEQKLVSLYTANMIAMGIKGASGNTAAARLFLGQVNAAASMNGEQNELARWALREWDKTLDQLEQTEKWAPPTSGVLVVSPEQWEARASPGLSSTPEEEKN